ncbi:aluminum resistance protein [Peptoanaerobacter stomatis]|uniref:Aluminum resistance protein n=1 Tax=Peptoanaerobacter stomatis TaxID=796937 RepID=G9X2F1_9FIRM|nr:methionine gamma-lyase family protein [Peptoanaerobacter stomatis]EHL11021.1 aluminum resistance protein [Peptoanaerobacter stomatis]
MYEKNILQMYDFFKISEEDFKYSNKIEEQLKQEFEELDKIKQFNQLKVLKAMQMAKLSDTHFNSSTGYGYNDVGREKVEEIYSNVFNTQDALVRPSIANGTHALSICLNALLMPKDTMLSISGKPYDTLDGVIGIKEQEMSLKEYNIHYKQIDLINDGDFDVEKIKTELAKDKSIKLVYIQRSKGYSTRKSIMIQDIKEIVEVVKGIRSDVNIMVDNCYGEFLDYLEPTDVGVDIMAGSLIKNPGGGLAITGGYIVGKEKLVDRCAKKLTSNSIGKECGLTFNTNRITLQGLFMAPNVVNGALKGAVFTAKLFEKDNYKVFPKSNDKRSDIIQAITFDTKQEVIEFCKAIQKSAPVDFYVTPEPWDMPGYDCEVIMAAGAFVQGSSIELSADSPIRHPYTVYFQGGLTYEHSKIGAIMAYNAVKDIK